MENLLKVCAEKKIIDKTYFNTFSRAISLSHSAARLKEKHIEEMLMEVQFDEIQRGQKSRNRIRVQKFGKNIK